MRKRCLIALSHLRNGNIEDALAEFAEEFCFTDRALGLEFTDRERLRKFLLKERELYSGSSFHVKKSVVTEDHVIAECCSIRSKSHFTATSHVMCQFRCRASLL